MSKAARYPDGKKIALYAAIGKRVHERRKSSGLSLRALAERIGATDSSIDKLEKGETPSLWLLTRLAEEFDCSLDDLVPVLASAEGG